MKKCLPKQIAALALVLTGACSTTTPLAPACRPWADSETSTEPPAHCLYFPGSLAMDPLGDILYVANTNADLSFGGSTVVSIDVLRHERAVACFRQYGRESGGDGNCGVVSCSDSGAALGIDASVEDMDRFEATSSHPPADFDRCYCERDLDDANIVNCESQRFIQADQSVKIGFFPGALRVLAEDPPNWSAVADETTLHRGLYITSRGDPSITFIDTTRPLCPGRLPVKAPSLRLDCGDESGSSQHQPGDPYTLRLCADQNRVQRTPDDVLTDPDDPNSDPIARFTVPPEPMQIAIDRGCIESGFVHERGTFFSDVAQNPSHKPPCAKDDGMGHFQSGSYYQYLVASHLGTGQVSAYDIGKDPTTPVPPVLQDVSDPLLPDVSGRKGAFAIASRHPGDLSQPWYVTSRLTGQISTFRLASAAGPRVVPGLALGLTNQFSSSTQDVRDLVFDSTGNRAFATVYTPPSLVLLDTEIRGSSGVPLNQVTGIVNLCLGPSRTVDAQIPWAYMGTNTRMTRLFVTCYLSGQVAEVDGDSGELLDSIVVGRGPLSIALNFGDSKNGSVIDPCADPYVSNEEAATRGITCPAVGKPDLRLRPLGPSQPTLGPRAYVSVYLDNSIAVLDLDPRSPSYRRVISRIGLPLPKQVQ